MSPRQPRPHLLQAVRREGHACDVGIGGRVTVYAARHIAHGAGVPSTLGVLALGGGVARIQRGGGVDGPVACRAHQLQGLLRDALIARQDGIGEPAHDLQRAHLARADAVDPCVPELAE